MNKRCKYKTHTSTKSWGVLKISVGRRMLWLMLDLAIIFLRENRFLQRQNNLTLQKMLNLKR